LRDHKVVIMPRAGEGRSVRIDPEVYEALLALKRGNMSFSDVIAQMLHDCYGWSDDFASGQKGLEDFLDTMSK
jgi:predicted CopG family antitoxin